MSRAWRGRQTTGHEAARHTSGRVGGARRRSRRVPAAQAALCLGVAAWLLGGGASLGAHDFWIEPTAYRPSPGALIGLRLLVGERMLGDPVVRESAFVKRFVAADAAREQPVPGREGGHPAGLLRVVQPGLMVVAYQSLPRAVELTPEKFRLYLGEEGLDEVRRLLPGGRPERPVRELYARCAKSLLLTGRPMDSDRDRALGLPFEIIAERNPYLATADRAVPFRLEYLGRPKADALVVAIAQRDPALTLTARSDPHGRVTLTFPVGGPWLVKAVHMTAARPGAGADWESYWASLTFEVPE